MASWFSAILKTGDFGAIWSFCGLHEIWKSQEHIRTWNKNFLWTQNFLRDSVTCQIYFFTLKNFFYLWPDFLWTGIIFLKIMLHCFLLNLFIRLFIVFLWIYIGWEIRPQFLERVSIFDEVATFVSRTHLGSIHHESAV